MRHPVIKKRTILVNGLSKSHSMTGWRIGYVAGDKDLVAAMNNIQSQSTSNPVSFCDKAAVEALNGPQDFIPRNNEAFKRRRDLVVSMLNQAQGIHCPTPEGAFYVYPSVKGVLGKDIRGKVPTNSAELASLILDEAEVAVVPGEAFGTPGYLRLSYATSDADITEGVGRMAALLAEAH